LHRENDSDKIMVLRGVARMSHDAQRGEPANVGGKPNVAKPRTSSSFTDSDLQFLSAPLQPDELGRLDHFRILKELGRGGMGLVFLAEDTKLDRKVALKVLLPAFARDTQARSRFLREAKAAAKIRHDHVITIYNVGEASGMPYISMELLKGRSLDSYLREKGELPLAQVLRIGREIALGLGEAHRCGLVHRDIKPANIWLEAPKGRVKILDFGLARHQHSDDTHLTANGAILGTPAFMSPEQAQGHEADARADLYSLGAVLYRLATGRPPFAGSTTMAVLTSVVLRDPPLVCSVNPQVPQEVGAIIGKLLSKSPEQRFSSAEDFLEEWERVMRGSGRTERDPQSLHSFGVNVAIAPGAPPIPVDLSSIPVAQLVPPSNANSEFVLPLIARNSRRCIRIFAISLFIAMAIGISTQVFHLKPSAVQSDGESKADEKGAEAALPKKITNSIEMELVRIDPGRFSMGAPADKSVGDNTLHDVEISKPIYLGKYEVTREQFERVMKKNPSTPIYIGKGIPLPSTDTKAYPVCNVSWYEAKEFCQKLSELEGKIYTLPTEAEWEFACRAGTTTVYSFGDTFHDAEANLSTIGGRLKEVGRHPPNPWGIFDMHGNVREWCEDGYDREFYKSSPTTDPLAPLKQTARVVRGGSYSDSSQTGTSAFRNSQVPAERDSRTGFRVVLRMAPLPNP
jgi:serine/threonine protein kinase